MLPEVWLLLVSLGPHTVVVDVFRDERACRDELSSGYTLIRQATDPRCVAYAPKPAEPDKPLTVDPGP